jgi:phage protein, HK97 gp10 family
MAKFDFEIPPEFIRTLGRLSDVDRYAPLMIDAATPTIEDAVKRELAKHRRTGTMLKSIKRTRAKKTKNGGYLATVRPTGESTKYLSKKGELKERKTAVRNMEIIAHMEYGTSKQPPTPVLSKALDDAKDEALKIMQETFNKEVSGS